MTPQGLGVRVIAGDQLIAQATQGGGPCGHPLARPEGFSDRREIQDLDLDHSQSASAIKRTMSPREMACPGGLSTRPSAQATEVSTPEP